MKFRYKLLNKFLILTLLSILILFNDFHSFASAAPITEPDIPESGSENWPGGPAVEAESAIVIEASTGTILYEKNINDVHYPASITKIMTTYLALEHSSLDEIVTFSTNAVYGIERDSSHIGIDVGEQLTMEQCLYGIMLASANEVSYAVAEHVAGDLDTFIQMMNDKAKELGCLNTNFNNANGLPDENHYTTVYDMALISRAALQNETFRKIASTTNYTIPPTNIQPESRYFENHHRMLRNTKYHYDGCSGGKTGYTTVALNTLVTFAEKDNMELICVTMKTQGAQVYVDTASLLDFGFENFQKINIAQNETGFTIGNSNFFHTSNNIFGNQKALVELNNSGSIILPKTASFTDASPHLTFDSDPSSKTVANLDYSYMGKYVGMTTIDMVNNKIETFEFSANSVSEEENETPEKKNFITINIKHVILLIIFVLVLTLLAIFLYRKNRFRRRGRRWKRRNKWDFDDFI